MMDNLKTSLDQFDKALAEAKGGGFFCGSTDSSKSLEPLFKQIVKYQQIFPVIAIYQDKKLKEETVSKVIDIVQKNYGSHKNIPSEKSLKTDQSPIKESTIKMSIFKEKCDYCELMVASTLIPNGYKVKKLLK